MSNSFEVWSAGRGTQGRDGTVGFVYCIIPWRDARRDLEEW